MNWRSLFFPKPRKFILRMCLLAVLLPLVGWVGGGLWFFDLFNHFQYQYLVFFFCCLILLLTLRAWREALIVSLLFILPAVRIAPSYFSPAATQHSHTSIRVASLNVLVSNQNHDEAIRWARSSQADCIYFSEVTDRWAKELQRLNDQYPFSIQEKTGFAFYSKRAITRHQIIRCSEFEFPLLIAYLTTPNGEVAVFGLHPLPPVSESWALALDQTITMLSREVAQQSGPVIVLGDFNITRWSKMSVPLERVKLLDASHGKSPEATWMRSNPLLAIPIDRILFRGPDMSCQIFHIGPEVGSDHRPVVADFAW